MKENFNKVINFFHKNKRMPSYREIADLLNFKSKNSAFQLIKKMIDLGLVSKDQSGKLIPGRLFREIPLLGTVEAGFPSPAEEELSDTMSLDDWLIENKEATYILKVQGDSMIDAGIMPGDLVLVERIAEAKDGDIIIAEIDNEWTMKYFRRRGSQVYLQAANKKYPNIFPDQDMKIAAKVKAVIRKY